MNSILLSAAASAALLASGLAAAPTITTGLFKVTTKSSLQSAPITEHSCISPAKAAAGGISVDLPGSCRLVRNVRAGGRLDIVAECGRGARMTVAGSYTAGSYDYVLTTAGGPMGAMTAHVRGQKVADSCQADDE